MSGGGEESGIIPIASRYSVVESSEHILATLRAKGINIFAVIDRSSEAEKVGLVLRPTTLIAFGDPKTGTPLMDASPSAREPNGLMNLAYVGALFLAAAALSLGIGLTRAARRME